MTPDGPTLILLTLAAIALLLTLILAAKLHAFAALLLTSMALGLSAGMAPEKLLKSIQTGFGEALGFIAVVVGLGAMIGRLIEISGGGAALADWLLARFGRDRAPWAMLTAAFLVGLPIFFEVGFIILVPVVWSLARESKKSLLWFGMPMAAALTVTHALVPPHPAPAAAAQLMGADLGRTLLYSAALAVPMAISGGIFYGRWIAKRMFVGVPEIAAPGPVAAAGAAPRVPVVVLTLLLPVLLIFAGTVGGNTQGAARTALVLLGHPFTALLATAILAMAVFGIGRGMSRDQLLKTVTDALAPVGTLLVIMGGGGALKQVIVDCGAGAYAGKMLALSGVSPLVVAYLVAVGLRIAQGSATVAIITAAGIVAPLVKGIPGYRPEMIVLALSCGGTILSHVNDAGFWIVKEYFGMTVGNTLRSWSVMKVITSIVGFALVLLAQRIFG